MVAINKRRFRVTAILTLVLFLVQLVAVADSTLSLNTTYYKFRPGLNILKPSIDYKNELNLDTSINARITVDRVHTDAVDAVSSASQTMGATIAKTDIRQEYLAGVTHNLSTIGGDWKVGTGFLVSLEKDYRSYSPSFSLSKDFNLRNTTLGFGYAHNFDAVHGQYMAEEKQKDVDNYSVALTQVLSKTTLLQVAYTNQINQGFLGTGNRKLVLENGLEYDEYLPSYRLRQAMGMRLAQWFASNTAVHLGYRYYNDGWELSSNTFEFKIYQKLNTYLKLKAEYRFYDQSAVYFAKDLYTGSERYLTTANSLRAFSSDFRGINLIYTPKSKDNLRLDVGFEQYVQSTGLAGTIFKLGLALGFQSGM